MAKKLLVSIVAFVLCVTVLATEMVVKQKNGENWRINVNEVEEIIFDESIPEDSAIVDTSVTPLKFKILSDSTVEVINDDSYREDAFPESITIPAKVRIEGKTYNVISIGDHAFRDCNGLISIKIPNSVSSIRKGAFSYCQSLTSINIPEGVTSIGSSAFFDCMSLTSIDIPEGVTSIGASTFEDCGSLKSISIPEGLTNIGEDAFTFCRSLKSIDIPESVTSIGNYAFSGCSNLDVTIDNSEDNVEVGRYTFLGCKSVTWLKEKD